MIIKLNGSNISEVIDYINYKLTNLSVVKLTNGLSERVFFDLYSDTFTLEQINGYVEFLGFSRIDGCPMFNTFDISHYIFLSNRKNKIESLLDEKIYNKVTTIIKNPKIDIIPILEDNSTPFNPPFKK